jgi:antitoxin component HigA of HigAB toxin-antitoxin module
MSTEHAQHTASKEVLTHQAAPTAAAVTQNLPALLKELMHARRLNQHELAGLLGLSDSSFSEFITGKRRLNIKLARKLHGICMIRAEVLFEMV